MPAQLSSSFLDRGSKLRSRPPIALELLYSVTLNQSSRGFDYFMEDPSYEILNPTENSLAVLNHKILEANSQVQNVKWGCHQTSLSINRLWHELCDMLRRLVGTTGPGHHDCSIQE
ncbi:uncharacterized protein TNCV_4518171 [Trichonephila clavipes]|nr:uncharacterized protein TNCV_4518171 [Trichonephila clavipes]